MAFTILLIEDDSLFADTIVDALCGDDLNIVLSQSVSEAFSATYTNKFDLIIIDIKLPDGSGTEILKAMRSWNSKIPILMLTSYTDSENLKNCFELGADDYIRKTCDLDEITARIRASIRKNYARTKTILFDSGYEFDIYAKRLLKDGIDVNLSPKANELLSVFCVNRGQILPFDILERAVWHTSEEASNGSLRVYINAIRKLIGEERIVNVKSIGYKLI